MTALPGTLTIIADDLTGAADAAGSYGGRSSAIVLDSAACWPTADIVAVDTESRYLSPEGAAERVAAAVHRSLAQQRPVFKKIDSLLRGHIGVEVAAALAALGGQDRGLAVVAPAFPATGRTTVGGIVHIDGAPNAAGRHGGDVAHALREAGLRVGVLRPRAEDTAEHLAADLERARADGLDAVVVDAVDDDDLERIARATELLTGTCLPTGSGGLAAHMLRESSDGLTPAPSRGGAERVLIVVGSYSGVARSQVDELVRSGATLVEVARLTDGGLVPLLEDLGIGGDVVLTPELLAPIEKDNALDVAAALAATASRNAHLFGALVLTGGETARAVLDTLQIDRLRVHGALEPGVVLSSHPDVGPLLVTKAGAFGDTHTLARIARSLRDPLNEE
ncbi:four-carbon acid sugar kinase family protein [Frondihabitans peucedani]|uniref:Four-carbon acid sugar kinase family protein n=1 Tax=Frondihabitans peucedani TaxID=598626 RepID=A0ABP8E1Q5_9MICO